MIDKEVRIGVLEHAQELLSQQRLWLQGELCTDENGVACSITSTEAASFCLLGAIRRSCYDLGHVAIDIIDQGNSPCPFSDNSVYKEVLHDCYHGDYSSYHVSKLEEGVGSFNDEKDTGYWDILALLARVIRNLKEEDEEDSD